MDRRYVPTPEERALVIGGGILGMAFGAWLRRWPPVLAALFVVQTARFIYAAYRTIEGSDR